MRWWSWTRRRDGSSTGLDCRQVTRMVQAFLDGESAAADATMVAEHLLHCGRCGLDARTLGQVIDAIRRQRPGLDPDRMARLAALARDLGEASDHPPSDGTI